jgi:hypothetical protein
VTAPSDPGQRSRADRTVALFAAAALGAALIALLALWPSSEAARQAVRFGFNNNSVGHRVATPDQAAAMIAAAGGEVDRVQINWSDFEPSPGQREFAFLDPIYEADLRHGVRPLFIFSTAPAWATNEPCVNQPDPCLAPPSPEHYDDMARTAAKIAQRYPGAAGIEIWNEPNTPHFWAPAADPHAYAKLLKACYRAIKRVRPRMPVTGGATSSGNPGPVPGHIVAPDYVSALKARRAFRHMDALSLHAYPDPGDTSGDSAVANAEAVRAVAKKRFPLWVTETGVSTTGSQAVSEEAQALTLTSVSTKLPAVPRVRMVLVHTLVDPPGAVGDAETGFGVVRRASLPAIEPALQPKSAYCALRQAWGGDPGCELPQAG